MRRSAAAAPSRLSPLVLLLPTKRLNAPSTLLGSITARERRKLARRETHTHTHTLQTTSMETDTEVTYGLQSWKQHWNKKEERNKNPYRMLRAPSQIIIV